ncbi:hypothetical protein FRC18_000720 [Serendipita sp. 400]|nr:hypothetical protein FRC18_000720 [Serendipita sp. 400]
MSLDFLVSLLTSGLFPRRATSCCLSMTLVNLALLARGHELGWTCLLICCLDICGNTLVMFWLTRPVSKYQSSVDNSVPSHTPANGNSPCRLCGAVDSSCANTNSSRAGKVQTAPSSNTPLERTIVNDRPVLKEIATVPAIPYANTKENVERSLQSFHHFSFQPLRSPRALEEGTIVKPETPHASNVNAECNFTSQGVVSWLPEPVSPLTDQTFPSAGSCSKSSPLRMTHLEERIAIDNALFHAPRRIDRTWKPKWTWSLSSDAHGERRPSTPGGVLGKFWSPRRPSDTGEGPTTSFARPRENEGEKTPSSTNYKSEATLCSLNVMVSVRTNNDALEDVEQLYECEDQMQETTNDFYHAI